MLDRHVMPDGAQAILLPSSSEEGPGVVAMRSSAREANNCDVANTTPLPLL